MFEVPKKIYESGSLIISYKNYVLKVFLYKNKKLKGDFNRELMFENEINFLQNCKSKFIIKLYYVDKRKKYIILERASCTLKKALKKKFITIKAALKFVDKLEKEFKRLNIIHRDLGYKNIVFFKKSKKCKVIDFETASYNNDLTNIYYKFRKKIDDFNFLRTQIERFK